MDLDMVQSDWQIGKSLPERMKYMLDNELMCDVTFCVGENRTQVKAHKYMLGSASPVFYSMFEGPLAEKGEVVISDIETTAFQEMLKYIYTDEVDISATNMTNIKSLIYGSEKYMLKSLKDKCSEFLESNIDHQHACVVFQTAHYFNMEHLKEESFQFILSNGKACFDSEHFLSLSSDCLKLILGSDDLHCNEEFIYEKILEWAKAKCNSQNESVIVTDENMREILGEMIYLIRFPVMDSTYFTKKISNSTVLTSQEIIQIFRCFHGEEIEKFNTKQRLPDAVEFKRCVLNESDCWNQTGNEDCIDFKTTFDALFSGITVFGSRTCSGTYEIQLNILQGSSTLQSISKTLTCTEGKKIYNIEFNNLLKISNNERYTIQLKMTGPQAFSGRNYESTVSCRDSLSVTFLDSSVSSRNSTDDSGGQIPGIILHPAMS